MMNARIILLTVTLSTAFSASAMAGDRGSSQPTDFFGFVQSQSQPTNHSHYCNGDVVCEERHMGLNIHADSVHPDIGAQTDQ